jgi:hypothetical protein
MRALVVRQRLARAAVVAASVALVAACGQGGGAKGNGSLGVAPGYKVGLTLVADGTSAVQVGDQKVTFPTTVTDAAFSPDGSRIVFVDGDGNIATARPDGKGVKVLTQKASGLSRSHPTWQGTWIVFAERNANSPSILKQVFANGSGAPYYGSGEADANVGENLGNESGSADVNQRGLAPSGAPTGKGKELAFERQGAGGEEIWVSDLNQRQPYQSKVAEGTSPALSLDGTKVAFVDRSGNIEVLDTVTKGAAPVQVSFGVASPKNLTWTPDGRVAYSTATGVESVAATAVGGSNPPTKLSSTPGVPAILPDVRDRVTRIAGADAVEVSIAASQASWKTVDVAYVSQSLDHATALLLTGSANLPTMLAGAQMVDDGPILFTTGSTLDNRTAAEMKRVLGRVDPGGFVPTVTIVGGTDVVSAAAEAAVKAMGYKTERTTAPDPVTMAAAVAGRPDFVDTVVLADASDVASYVSAISDLGRGSQQTVLLTNGSTMPDRVKTFLNGLKAANATVYPIGSAAQSAVSSSWAGKPSLKVSPLSGTGAMLTAFSGSAQTVVLVDRSNLADVITAVGLARTYGAPVLAVDPKAALDDGVKSWLDGSSGCVDTVFIVDSKGAIGADLEHAVSALVAGPLGANSNTNPKFAA